MADPLKWRNKIILAKLEAQYGDDPAPTGAENGILAVDVQFTPMEGSDVDRDLELPYLGAQGTIPTELHAKLSYKVELVGSDAAGTPPAYSALLRACAMAEVIDPGTSSSYNPISDGHESVSHYFWNDTTLYKLRGCRGNVKYMVTAQGVPYLEFDFTGLWVAPEDAVRDVPTLTGYQRPQVGTHANTPVFQVSDVDLVLRSFTLDFGNQVENRFLIGDESILITDKAEAIEMTVVAVPLADLDPYVLAKNQTTVPVVLQHGTIPGRIATLSVPAAQMQRPQGLSNAQGITEWPLRLIPLPTVGNDQFTLTFT